MPSYRTSASGSYHHLGIGHCSLAAKATHGNIRIFIFQSPLSLIALRSEASLVLLEGAVEGNSSPVVHHPQLIDNGLYEELVMAHHQHTALEY